MNIELFNCNSIDHGSVSIEPGRLNIKYGINGTGKSSFARALESAFDQAKLDGLTPYKYLDESPVAEDHRPKVNCPDTMKRVAIFNDTYVSQYLFQADDELMPNSFEILVKTADYDQKMAEIQRQLDTVGKIFQKDPRLDALISELSSFIVGFGKAQNGYSKTGSLGKGIAKGNKIRHIPPELAEYAPLIQSEDNIKWLSWQSKGKAWLGAGNLCPYCAAPLPQERRQTVLRVEAEYDTKYVTELQKMLDVFHALRDYFSDAVNEKIDAMAASAEPFTDDQIGFLKEVKQQVDALYHQLNRIRSLSYGTLKDVKKMADELKSAKIDLEFKAHVNTPHTAAAIGPLNDAIDQVLASTGALQKAIGMQKTSIRKTIAQHEGSINGFLRRAGYKYQVAIEPDPTGDSYKLVLKSLDTSAVISNARSHLSYGERNAFALVLFMYQALREEPDLIIMDDPISSFDQNKKYAIMDMLFRSDNTFKGKTVLMLTHDFELLIDLVHTKGIRSQFKPEPTAAFLYNRSGELIEKSVGPDDIMSFVQVADTNLRSDADEINKLIYLRRKLEVLGEKNMGWQLLSNIFHNRRPPMVRTAEGFRPMEADEIATAIEEIAQEIEGFDYDRVDVRIQNISEMLRLYHDVDSNYEKVQLFRTILMCIGSKRAEAIYRDDSVFKKFIDGAYHIENDSLFQLDPTKYPTIPDYIVRLCDEHIQLLEASMNK